MPSKLIYDRIHGNIEISNLETIILKSPYVNRLHQVIQNSTAYLVFPSCKTSRFEHSLGVLDYSSQLFLNGIRNSVFCKEYVEDKTNLLINGLLKEIDFDYFKGLECDKNLHETIKELFGDKIENIQQIFDNGNNTDKLIDGCFKLLDKSFLERNLGYEFSKFDLNERFTYIILFEAVRLYGLFHDLGHLPFSHIFEFCLEYLHENDVLENPELRKDLSKIFEQPGEIEKDAIHELIGKKIIDHIFDELKNSVIEKDETSGSVVKLIIIGCIQLVLVEIRKGDIGKLASLYSIVSSAVDADRIDFVQRDGSVSGFSKDIGGFERIIKLYYLAKKEEVEGEQKFKDTYIFLPTIQSLYDIEKLLNDRFKIYKYMVNHHSVKKFDYIFQVGIEQMFIEESTGDYTGGLELNKFIDVIGVLTDVFTIDKIEDKGEKAERVFLVSQKFTQLTDSWLLSLFTKKYFQGIKYGMKAGKPFDDPKLVKSLLINEIYTNKRDFTSLWKRVYNYKDFLEKLGGAFDLKYLRLSISTMEAHVTLRQKVHEHLRSQFPAIRGDEMSELLKYETSKNGLDNNLLNGKICIEILKTIHPNSWTRKIEDEANNNQKDYHILVARTRVKPGFSDIKLVDNKTARIVAFDELSDLKRTLDVEKDTFIKFFVYFCTLKHGNEDIEAEKRHVEDIIIHSVHTLLTKKRAEFNENIEKMSAITQQ